MILKNNGFPFIVGLRWAVFLIPLVSLLACRKTEPVFLAADLPTTIPPTLVSTQPVAADQMEVVVKAGFQFGPSTWQLTMHDAGGRAVNLKAGTTERTDLFELTPYRATGLNAGQTYQLRFATRNAGGDSVKIERLFTQPIGGPNWIRLAHAPLVVGDFVGSVLSSDNLPANQGNNFLSVWRYQNEQSWQTLSYFISGNEWLTERAFPPTIRHGLVRFSLQEAVGDIQPFNGLGFVTSELQPGQRLYQKDMAGIFPIVPFYAGPDGEIRFFTTLERAYQLTEGSTQVWVREGNWNQYRTADLPEPGGTLATFRIGTTGYVVNQRPGLPAHLWAFDTRTEVWNRRADFPGTARRQGIGFTAGGVGFFGLGIDANEETLRDIWQYNPTTNQWQYVTDYPGQGSTYLTVGQLPNHTFLGWGYEQQPTATGGVRLVGCTDFWEIKP